MYDFCKFLTANKRTTTTFLFIIFLHRFDQKGKPRGCDTETTIPSLITSRWSGKSYANSIHSEKELVNPSDVWIIKI